MGEQVSLKEFIEGILAERDKAIAAALSAAEKAVDKAEADNRKWREAANEWRGAMTDRERDFLTRREFYSIIGAVVLVVGVVVAIVQSR